MPTDELVLEPLTRGRCHQARELAVLGTAAQVPTRSRNHNAYLLRWAGKLILFDPGEGAQRQLLHAGISASGITAICITHFHGDHCLGLPGILARFALDRRSEPVDIYFPAAGAEHLERLRRVAALEPWPGLRLHALPLCTTVQFIDDLRLVAAPLHHTVPTLGWRLEEPVRRHVVVERAAAAGIHGPGLGELVRNGAADAHGRRVRFVDVSEARRGRSFAFVMDTSMCDEAVQLAGDADLVVTEATYLDAEAYLAARNGHLTARQAGWIACEAGAGALLLSHFSQRHPDAEDFAHEAGAVFPGAVAARDLTVAVVPRRR